MSKILEATVTAPATETVEVTTTPTTKVNRIVKDGLVLNDLYTELKTTSNVIRKLHSLGYTRSEISDFTGKIYQHVRNVLVQDAQRAEAKAKQTSK